jgi:hypothetical protein
MASPQLLQDLSQIPPQPLPPTDGSAGAIGSPAAMDMQPPQGAFPGSLPPDTQAPQAPNLGPSAQETLSRLPQQGQQGAFSENNPFAATAKDLQARYQSSAPPPVTGGPMRHLLTNFLGGAGNAMMNHVGLMTPQQQRQNLLLQSMQATQLANSWENTQSEIKLRQAQTQGLTQDQNFRSQMQPLQLQHEGLANQAEQFGLDQARQDAPNVANQIPLDETTAKLAGIPTKFVGQNLSVDDWKMVDARLRAQGYQKFDTGKDGPQGGIWLMDRGGNKIKQLTPVSESNRATQIAKAQIAATQNNIATPTGQDYGQQIQSLGPKGGIVAGIIEGRQSMPSAFALKTPYWQGIMQAVYQIDPQFSEQRAQLRKSYTVGKQSGEINAINTAMGHVGVLGDSIDALNNGDVRVLNSIANRVGVEIGSTPVTTFNTIVHRVGPELSKAYIGSGGSAGERGADEKDFDPARGPAQIKNNVGITAQLLRSKISSLQNQWDMNRAPGMKSFQDQFIMPEAKRQLDKWAPAAPNIGTGGNYWDQFPVHK